MLTDILQGCLQNLLIELTVTSCHSFLVFGSEKKLLVIKWGSQHHICPFFQILSIWNVIKIHNEIINAPKLDISLGFGCYSKDMLRKLLKIGKKSKF